MRPSFLFFFLLLLAAVDLVLASPLSLQLGSCSKRATTSTLAFTEGYAQLVPNTLNQRGPTWESGDHLLRVVLLGTSSGSVNGYDNTTEKLSTLFTTVSFLSSTLLSSSASLCNSLSSSPATALPATPENCIIPAGPIALNLTLPLHSTYPLTTLRTHVRIVDAAVPPNELACVDVETTPYYPGGWYYRLILWVPVGVAVAYWCVTWGARGWAGWGVGVRKEGERVGTRGGRWGRVLGTAVMSTVSGDVMVSSPALLRFVTPGFKDIIAHLQFCTCLAMIAVQWPNFFYPIAARGAWSTLLGNVTLVQGSDASSKLFDPLASTTYSPPSAFANQLSDPTKAAYLDAGAANVLLRLDAKPGIPSFAHAVGLREEDLFGTATAIFLLICAALIIASLLVWVIHGMADYFSSPSSAHSASGLSPQLFREQPLRGGGGEGSEFDAASNPALEMQKGKMPGMGPNGDHTPPTAVRRKWWKYKVKGNVGAFYASSLQGNLIRLLLLFHLPLTLFSVHQFTLWHSPTAPSAISTLVLAVFAFLILSLLLPAYLLTRLFLTPSPKLYDATRTLLSLGPLYNLYGEGSQRYAAVLLGASLVVGVVIGAGQGSGTAQAVILLVVEIAVALVTSVWLPWGEGASMGGTSFTLCVARVVTMVLVLILCQAVDVGSSADAWITYAICVIQAVVFLLFILTLVVKIIEFIIRLSSHTPFDQSNDPYDSGLLGAMNKLSCCGEDLMRASGRRRKRRHQTGRKGNSKRNSDVASSQQILDLSQRSTVNSRQPSGSTSGPNSAYGGAYDSSGYAPRPMEEPPLDDRGFIMSGWRPPTGYAPMQPPQPYQGQPGPSYHGQQPQQPQQPNQQGVGTGALGGPAPSRGFSMVRGGRAAYESPYALVPPTSPTSPTPSDRPFYNPPQSSSQQHPPPSSQHYPPSQQPQQPLAASQQPDRPRNHQRTKSETAVVENFGPPSVSSGGYQYGPSYSHHPSPSFAQAGYAVGAQRQQPQLQQPETMDEVDIASDSDETTTPAPRRQSWFVRNSTRKEESEDSETDDGNGYASADLQPVQIDLLAKEKDQEPSGSRWPFGRKKAAGRTSGGGSEGDKSSPARTPPLPPAPSTPPTLGAAVGNDSPASATPGKSFSVLRPPKITGNGTGSSADGSHESGHSAAPSKSSFVVNRPNRQTPPVTTPRRDASPARPAKSPMRRGSEDVGTAL